MSAAAASLDQARISEAVGKLRQYMTDTLTGFVQCRSLPGQEMSAAAFMEDALADLGLASERIALRTEELKNLPLYSPACCPCLLYTSPSPRDVEESRMPSSA